MKKTISTLGWSGLFVGIYMLMQALAGFFCFYTSTKDMNIKPISIDMNILRSETVPLKLLLFICFAAAVSLIFYLAIQTLRGRRLIKDFNFKCLNLKRIIYAAILGVITYLLMISIIYPYGIYSLPEFTRIFNNKVLTESLIFKRVIDNFSSVIIHQVTIQVFILGILLPVFEEILFRGLIINELQRVFKVYQIIIIQAVLYGLIHLNNITQAVCALGIGVVLGIAYFWRNTLWEPIAVHIAYNTLIVLSSHFNSFKEKILLLYSPTTYDTADIISSFVSRQNSQIKSKDTISQLFYVPIHFRVIFVTISGTILVMLLFFILKSIRARKAAMSKIDALM